LSQDRTYNRLVVIGASAGGLQALSEILKALPADFRMPLIIVQHLSPRSDSYWITRLNDCSKLEVKEAEEKEMIQAGIVYFAPPDYHLLVEKDGTMSFSYDEKVNFSRPSIDVLFETASDACKEKLVGVLLTGASKDGAQGIKTIKENGGLTIVQSPVTAQNPYMPQSAIDICNVDHVVHLEQIADLLIKISGHG
jgi:two-component system, chemotaxis family, protein-glutamate methylesterase/glutaminase